MTSPTTAPGSDQSAAVDSPEEPGAWRSASIGPDGERLGSAPVRHRWVAWLWRTLTSMRTAVMLLALLALAAVPGSVLPQRGVSSDPTAVPRFIRENPDLAPWLDRLGLFNVYSSPWFAAVYLLLLVSMTGCVLPRCVKLWDSVRAEPPSPPRHLDRLTGYRKLTGDVTASQSLQRAADHLRRRGFRVVVDEDAIRAEKGYARELGNLVFHLSLLVLLVGVAAGKLWGFEGRVAVVEGAGFANVVGQYDEFSPSAFTDVDNLEPFRFSLKDFQASFETSGIKRGEARSFAADVEVQTNAGSTGEPTRISPNRPLVVNGTKVFLTGHGYAPVVTVRDGRGDVVFTGPVIFLPLDASYASDGVVKAPDARPEGLGFEGFFLPTGAIGPNGPYSTFPGAMNPQLFLTAYAGDLGMGDGLPQDVYTLDKDDLTQFRSGAQPLAKALSVGDTMTLPQGRGSITFDRVGRFANFQIAYDPGKEVALLAAVLLLVGLTTSLSIRRRRVWVRAVPTDHPSDQPTDHGNAGRVELACMPLTRRGAPHGELDELETALRQDPSHPAPENDLEASPAGKRRSHVD